MKKVLLILGILISILAIATFWIYQQRGREFALKLDQVRQSVGTKRASLLLEKLAKAHPNNAEVQYLTCRQFRLEDESDRALACGQRASELGYSSALINREMILIRAQKDFQQVEPELQRLLEADPEDQDVILSLALGWSKLGNLAKAEVLVNSVLQRDPENGAALWVRGKIRLQKHLPHDACPDLEKAVGSGTDQYYHSRARFQLANCYLELGKFDRALELFQKALAEDPENSRVLFGLGRCYWFLNRWEEAGECLREVLRRQPDHLDALSQLAYIHEERGKPGDYKQALELLERAAKLDPTWYDLHFRMARIMKSLGQDERAAQEYQRAEQVKKAWAKPRTNPFAGRNPYTGDESGALRRPVND
jgi:tetratricopeptide (TPR) repeat protein